MWLRGTLFGAHGGSCSRWTASVLCILCLVSPAVAWSAANQGYSDSSCTTTTGSLTSYPSATTSGTTLCVCDTNDCYKQVYTCSGSYASSCIITSGCNTDCSTCTGSSNSLAWTSAEWANLIAGDCYTQTSTSGQTLDAANKYRSGSSNWDVCATSAPTPAPGPVVVEMAAPTKNTISRQNVTVYGSECVWAKWTTESSFSSADSNTYTTTVKTDATTNNCQPSWFAIGAPAATGTGAPVCTSAQPAGSSYPFFSSITQFEKHCMTAGKIQYIGFYSECSTNSTPATAIVEVSMTTFCDEDEKTTWSIILWVVVGLVLIGVGVGIYFCWRCCCREADPNEDKSQIQWVLQPNTTIQGVGIQPSNVVINMTNEREKVDDYGIKDVDERHRLKAAASLRDREEKKAAASRRVAEEERLKMDQEMKEFDETIRRKKDSEAQREEQARQRHEEAHNQNQQNAEETASILGEAQKEISGIVTEAYTLPLDQRKAKLKQLRMRWHPDKNPMLKALATDIMKIINQEIEQAEKNAE